MKSIKVCEYSRSRSFHYDLILQDQASGELSQDQWSSGFIMICAKIEKKTNMLLNIIKTVNIYIPVLFLSPLYDLLGKYTKTTKIMK